MKFRTRRKESGQIAIGDAGSLAVFLPVFGLLFAILFNVSVMLIYMQRLTFLAIIASFYYAYGAGAGNVPTWISGLHLPGSTQVVFGGPISCNGAGVLTATASTPYNAMGFYQINLSDTEGTIQAQY